MRQIPRILLYGLLTLLVGSCNRSSVSITYTTAKGEIEPLQNLVFTFDHPLANDSMLNRWDSTEYIRFTPKVTGRFRWERPDQLVFSPASPFKPATEYEAELQDELVAHVASGRIGQSGKLRFHTPALRLENALSRWVAEREGSTKPVAEIDLFFNYDVNPSALKDQLSITIEGNPVSMQVRTVSTARKITARVIGLQPVDKNFPTTIRVNKTLLPEGGTQASTEDHVLEAIISSPFNLAVTEVTSDHDGNRATIYVRTSQQVVMENLAASLSISPAVKFNVAPSDDGFVVTSDAVNPDKSYTLEMKKGIRGVLGGILREDQSDQVVFGELEPALKFTNNKGIYLSSKGNEFIELNITNVPRIKVIVSKIYESNLMAATRYGYYPVDKAPAEEGYYYEESAGSDYVTGDVVFEKEIETSTLQKFGKSRLFKFNIEDQLPDFKGIYHIKIRSSKDYWLSDSRFISKSDIGLIAREGKTKMIVFANSIRTTEILDGVKLSVYGANNQLLGIGNTNKDGIAEITYNRTSPAGFQPSMIIAKTADDFTYLPLTNTQVNTSRFELGGKTGNASGLDAFIYEERDIYRPGETIHYSVVVRDRKWNVPGALPVIFKFLLPNGKEYSLTRKTLNEQGAAEGSLPLPVAALTGTYTLEVYSGTMVLLASHNYSVEEFVPDRLRLTVKSDKKVLRPDEKITMAVHADNFFGPPAAGRKFESELQVRAIPFRPKGLPDFNFTLQEASVSFDKKVTEGVTTESGDASVNFTAPLIYRDMGVLEAKNYFTVFDETGRPVSRSITIPIITQDYFLGIADNGIGYFALNQPVQFPLVAVNYDGQRVNGVKAKIKIIKHEYRTILAKSGSYFRYESQKDDKIVAEEVINLNGQNGMISFVPRTPGEYEVRAFISDLGSYVSRKFYSYGSWGDNSSFEVNTEGQVDIEADKALYAPGEKARLLFKTPFPGRLLVTMEQDEFISSSYVEVKNRSGSIELPINEACLPNVYITATLIKPHQVSDIPLTVAHGFKSLVVEKKDRQIPVQIIAGKTSRSKTSQKISVKATPGSYVTLAAVDNGVLQVTDFKSPDPYRYFYSPRALGVKAYDLYPLLLPELRATLSSTGGDGETDMNKRTNPMPAQRVKIASYWSGLQQVNSSGVASFQVEVPAFSGELRLMAVAFKNNSFGRAEATMTVADPLVLSLAAPRFASPGDTLELQGSITNTTNRSYSVTASIEPDQLFKILGTGRSTVAIAPGKESVVNYKLIAAQSIGAGKINLKLKSGNDEFQELVDISVRPSVANVVRSGNGVIKGGTETAIKIPTSGFIPQGVSYQLVIGRSPVADLGSELKYLVQYPFGCTEQVVSTVFPQLYFEELATAYKDGNSSSTTSAINEAIRILKMRQIYNGGLTLWENGAAHWWTSIYAAHFLIEAKKAGYDTDERLLNGILEYINSKLKNRETVDYYYNRDQQRKIAPKEIVYSLYVLNLANRPNLPVMNYYKANTGLLSLDSRYLLSAAFALGGDRKSFQQLLPGSFAGEQSVAATGGSFYSELRDEAIALDVLLSVDPKNTQAPIMAKHISDKLKSRGWYSTQEAAFSLLALGKFAKLNAGATVTGSVLVNGKPVQLISDKTVRLTAKQLGGSDLLVRTRGEGNLYYSWQSEGVPADGGFHEEDSYLKARRRYFDRYGKLITRNGFKQNEIIIVEVSVAKLFSGKIENVVATDILPAGFEIENPRTNEIPGMDWIKNASEPLSLDVRDDRINFFLNLDRPVQTYFYAVRAVTPGAYHAGPVSAEAMYNGDYRSYHGASVIRIVR